MKAVTRKDLDIQLRALAVDHIYETVNSVDLILLTPPLASRFEEIKEKVNGQVPVVMISGDHYIKYNGEEILEEALPYIK
jgi:cellobiose-specific phosphotransferase system component IIB